MSDKHEPSTEAIGAGARLQLVKRLRECAFFEFPEEVDANFEPEITWQELRDLSLLLTEAADALQLVREVPVPPQQEYIVPPTTTGGNETVVREGIYTSRKPFSALRDQMSPEAQERARARTAEMLRDMDHAPVAPSPAGWEAEKIKRLARSFAQEWLRPDDPDLATPALVDKLQTVMLAFFACARGAVASAPLGREAILIDASQDEREWVAHAAGLRGQPVEEYVKRAINEALRKQGVDAVLFAESDDAAGPEGSQ